MRVAEPALQSSPVQQLISHSNDPLAALQVGLVSLSQKALGAQPLEKVSTPPPLKWNLKHLSAAGATQVVLDVLHSSHDLVEEQTKHFKLNTERNTTYENSMNKPCKNFGYK